MLRHMQDETGIAEDKSVPELLADIDEYFQIDLQTPGKGCVYVMAAPGIEAVRIGRTVDLPQRLRRFEYKNFPVEVILVGNCNVVDGKAEGAEAEIFRLLDDIHLAKYNPHLYRELWQAGYDWYLPDRRKILDAFWSLRGGRNPRFVEVQKQPTFERFTKLYPAYATPDQIFHVVDD